MTEIQKKCNNCVYQRIAGTNIGCTAPVGYTEPGKVAQCKIKNKLKEGKGICTI